MDSFQIRQAKYDSQNWEHNEKQEKIRHICLHLGKLMGKISTYCEEQEHGKQSDSEIIKHQVIPDLVVYATQLASIFDVNSLEQSHIDRLGDL